MAHPCPLVWAGIRNVLLNAGGAEVVGETSTAEQTVRLTTALKRICAGERVWLPGPQPERAPSLTMVSLEGISLTPREQEILTLKLRRYSNAEIGESFT